MSNHLPECPYVVFDQQGLIPATVIPGGCICPALRECEQRVRDDERRHLEQPRYDMMLAMLNRLGGRVHLTAAEILAMDTSVMVRVYNDPSDLSCVIEVLRGES